MPLFLEKNKSYQITILTLKNSNCVDQYLSDRFDYESIFKKKQEINHLNNFEEMCLFPYI